MPKVVFKGKVKKGKKNSGCSSCGGGNKTSYENQRSLSIVMVSGAVKTFYAFVEEEVSQKELDFILDLGLDFEECK